jgi:PIN domain nuclease of toxin-antitoxin system
MKVLLDSHTLIWAVDDPAKITTTAMAALQNPGSELLVSAASVWEIAIKVGNGKLPLSLSYRAWMDKALADLSLSVLAVTLDHTERLVGLPFHHRDPFDRLVAVQALVEVIPLVSADPIFDAYGVNRIWN